MERIQLLKLQKEDIEQFIIDNQEAFNYGALEEFGIRDEHFEEEGEIISRETILESINDGIAYRIYLEREKIGGVVLMIEENHGELELFFVSPKAHSKGIGQTVWYKLEEMYPEVKVWETVTPYFEKRNINFYVNKLGFHIVEFFNEFHKDPNCEEENDEMFRFVKEIK